MLAIVKYPDEILRGMSVAVENKVADKDREEIRDLVEVLQATKNGVGLAAPQLGISKRFFGIKNEKTKVINVYINPEILDDYGEKKKFFEIEKKNGDEEPFMEGCLSLPEVYGQVARWDKIKVKWMSLDGSFKIEVLAGYVAIVFQHELDHLNGVLFVDHVKKSNGKLFREVDGKMTEISFEEL